MLQDEMTREELLTLALFDNDGNDVNIESLTVTQNGTYSSGDTAYSPVTVAIDDTDLYRDTTDSTYESVKTLSNCGAFPMSSLKVSIEPQQDLHGGAGKNKLQNNASTTTINDVTLTVNSDGTVTANGTATDMLVFTVGTVTFTEDTSVIYSGASGGAGWSYSINVKIGSVYQGDVYDGDSLSMTVTANTIVTYVIVVRGGVTLNNVIFKPMIRLATETDPTYEPYSNICPISGFTEAKVVVSPTTDAEDGTTYTIDLDGTRYGGTLDVVSGELVVTHGYIASYNGETLPSTWISDRDVYAEGTTPTIGAEVCYELATPYTIQLTPTQVKSLLGTNNLWADTGDVGDVRYFKKVEL